MGMNIEKALLKKKTVKTIKIEAHCTNEIR